MARLFTEGFEVGSGLQGMTAYSSSTGSGGYTVTADAKTWGKGAYCGRVWGTGNAGGLGTNTQYAYKTFTASSEIYVRISFRTLSSQGDTRNVIQFLDGGGTIVAAIADLTASGGTLHNLSARKGSSTDLGSLDQWDSGWHTLQCRLKNTTGAFEFEIKIDGNTYVNYADTSPVGAGNIAQLRFNQEGTNLAGMDIRFDDIAINDTTGGVDDSWIPEGTIVALVPNGNGDSSDLYGSDGNSTDNYLLVDERPPDSDTTYVWGDVANMTDLYAVSSPTLTSGESYSRLWIVGTARKTGVSGLNYQPTMKNGTTTTNEATASPQTTAYQFYASAERLVNPATSSAWSDSDVQNIQIGVKVVAT